jgi:hypothetical protein
MSGLKPDNAPGLAGFISRGRVRMFRSPNRSLFYGVLIYGKRHGKPVLTGLPGLPPPLRGAGK